MEQGAAARLPTPESADSIHSGSTVGIKKSISYRSRKVVEDEEEEWALQLSTPRFADRDDAPFDAEVNHQPPIDVLGEEEDAAPKRCSSCGSPVNYRCRTCPSFYLCEDCFFGDANAGHDPTHAFDVVVDVAASMLDPSEFQSNTSETSGSLLSSQGSLLYDPCKSCGRVILDSEVVYTCASCEGFVICAGCYERQTFRHDPGHHLQEFQHHAKDVQRNRLTSKHRDEEGNKVINDYVVVKLLGKGAFGKVKLVQNVKTKELFAMKIIRFPSSAANRMSPGGSPERDGGADGVQVAQLLREIAVMTVIDHPNIVRLVEVIEDSIAQKIYIIMEYCAGGPMHTLGAPPLPDQTIRKYATQMITAVNYLHSKLLFHRDIKPANCLIDGDGNLKVADFGTTSGRAHTTDRDGTPAYQCPELLRGDNATGYVADSWAVAVTVLQAASGENPFLQGSDRTGLLSRVLSDDEVRMPDSVDVLLGDLLSKMLKKDVKQRLLLCDAYNHAYFTPVSSAELRRVSRLAQTIMAQSMSSASRSEESLRLFEEGLKCVKRGGCVAANMYKGEVPDELDFVMNVPAVAWDSTALSMRDSRRRRSSSMHPGGSPMSPASDPAIEAVAQRKLPSRVELIDIRFRHPPEVLNDEAPQLSYVKLYNNGVTSLAPLKPERFTQLATLIVASSCLSVFPAEALEIPTLERLNLSYNLIAEIPDDVGRHERLTHLSLHGNRVEELHNVSPLMAKNLRVLRITENPLVKLPPDGWAKVHDVEIIADNAPPLVEQWGSIVATTSTRCIVVLRDAYPQRVCGGFYVTPQKVDNIPDVVIRVLGIGSVVARTVPKKSSKDLREESSRRRSLLRAPGGVNLKLFDLKKTGSSDVSAYIIEEVTRHHRRILLSTSQDHGKVLKGAAAKVSEALASME
jgi:serine/threonine protein kinase